MSNRFLSYGNGGGADLAQLQNGSFAINVSEIVDQSLTPGIPVVTNDKLKLISKLISTNELDANLNNFVETLNDKTVNIPGGYNPFIYTTGPPINQDVNRVYLDDEANLYARSDAGFPQPSALPNYYTGVVYNVDSEAQLTLDLITAADYDIINITADITLTNGPQTINKKLKIQSLNGSRITLSWISYIFQINVGEVWFDGLTFNNINLGSSANILNFSGLNNTKNFVTNCTFETNEFAITSNNNNIQITNNVFKFVGVPDSHRYILLGGCQGPVFINDNIFQGNGGNNTQCILLNNTASNYLNGHLIIKNNVSQLSPVQRLLMVESSMVGTNFSLYVSSNNCITTSGFIIFYSLPLSGVKQIYLYNNVETLAPGITGSKGIIGIDSGSASVISFDTKVYSADNIVPVLRGDYTDLVNPDANQPRVIAYAAARFSPAQSYDVIVPFIKNLSGGGSEDAVKNPFESDVDAAGFSITNLTNINSINVDDLGDKTQYMSAPITLPPQTKFLYDVEADSFIKTGGTNQQYLMADGSSLQYSANSGNSNFYLYVNKTTLDPNPPDGDITYNNATQSLATEIYISHRTRDDIDIEVFFKNISQLQDVYIQDQAISENYIRYNITGPPVITVDSKVTIPVAVIESMGTGSTSFGNNKHILLSFFTNNIETDLRISTLETKTQNITTNASGTNFTKNTNVILAGSESVVIKDNSSPFSVAKFIVSNTSVQVSSVDLLMNSRKIQLLGAPTANGDAANKSYVDSSVSNVVRNPMTGTLFGGSNGILEVTFIECESLTILSAGFELNGNFLHKRNSSPLFYQTIYEKPGGVLDGDTIFRAEYNTINTTNHAGVRVLSAGDQTGSNHGCDYIIRTCLSNNTGVNDRFRIAADNHTYITGNLDVAGSSRISLNPALNDAFIISNNSTPFSVAKFIVSDTSAQFISVPLLMNNGRIQLLGTPMDNGDATNKSYVDNAVSNIPINTQDSSAYWARQPWTSRVSAVDNNWQSICWSPEVGLLVAVSSTGTNDRVMTSPNGINWTSRSTLNDAVWRSICWSPEVGLFVAVASSDSANTRVMTSPNGIDWTNQLSFTFGWGSVCWSPEKGLFVAVNSDGLGSHVMTSPNGVNWIMRSSPESSWRSICWSKEVGLFVAVAAVAEDGNDSIMTSPDAINWTIQSAPSDIAWTSVCWSKEVGLFVAVSENGTDRVMTSPNGINWTSRQAAAINTWQSICWSKEVGLFVAVSSSGNGPNRVMTSPNGINWTSRQAAVNTTWRGVCWSPELFMFVAVSISGTGNRVMTSP